MKTKEKFFIFKRSAYKFAGKIRKDKKATAFVVPFPVLYFRIWLCCYYF